MRTRKRKEVKGYESVGATLEDTKVNHEPTDQQLREFIDKKKKASKIFVDGKEIMGRVETFTPIEQASIKKADEVPKIPEEQPRKKFVLSKMTDEEKEMFNARNEWIREQRRNASVQKILKEMAQNKYSPFLGKKINIRGELYEVKPIDRKSKERKQ